MSDAILVLHHLTSVALSLCCWWLAHQNARADPPGTAIAVGYALTGFLFLAVALARDAGTGIEVSLVATKLALLLTLVSVSYRRHMLKER